MRKHIMQPSQYDYEKMSIPELEQILEFQKKRTCDNNQTVKIIDNILKQKKLATRK